MESLLRSWSSGEDLGSELGILVVGCGRGRLVRLAFLASQRALASVFDQSSPVDRTHRCPIPEVRITCFDANPCSVRHCVLELPKFVAKFSSPNWSIHVEVAEEPFCLRPVAGIACACGIDASTVLEELHAPDVIKSVVGRIHCIVSEVLGSIPDCEFPKEILEAAVRLFGFRVSSPYVENKGSSPHHEIDSKRTFAVRLIPSRFATYVSVVKCPVSWSMLQSPSHQRSHIRSYQLLSREELSEKEESIPFYPTQSEHLLESIHMSGLQPGERLLNRNPVLLYSVSMSDSAGAVETLSKNVISSHSPPIFLDNASSSVHRVIHAVALYMTADLWANESVSSVATEERDDILRIDTRCYGDGPTIDISRRTCFVWEHALFPLVEVMDLRVGDDRFGYDFASRSHLSSFADSSSSASITSLKESVPPSVVFHLSRFMDYVDGEQERSIWELANHKRSLLSSSGGVSLSPSSLADSWKNSVCRIWYTWSAEATLNQSPQCSFASRHHNEGGLFHRLYM